MGLAIIRMEKDGHVRIYAHVDQQGNIIPAEQFGLVIPKGENISADQFWLAEVLEEKDNYVVVKPIRQINTIVTKETNIWTGETTVHESKLVLPEEIFYLAHSVKLDGDKIVKTIKFVQRQKWDKTYFLKPSEHEEEVLSKFRQDSFMQTNVKRAEIEWGKISGSELRIFAEHAKEVVVDGDKQVVTFFDPDEWLTDRIRSIGGRLYG